MPQPSAPIELWLNGEARSTTAGTLAELLLTHNIAPGTPGVAVALNHQVVPGSAWAQTPLKPNDRVEVVWALQGG